MEVPLGPGLPPLPSASGEASQTAWLDHYGGGWQELFPNAGAACTVDGAAHLPRRSVGRALELPQRACVTPGG